MNSQNWPEERGHQGTCENGQGKSHEVSVLHREWQTAKECRSGISLPISYLLPSAQLWKHTSNIIWSGQVILRVTYVSTNVHMHMRTSNGKRSHGFER